MLITREADYAIRALRALSDGGKWTLARICEKEFVPHQFGYKIMKKLALAGYVVIKRGKDGGYVMADSVKDRTLLDLMNVMESSASVSPCVDPEYVCEVHKGQEQFCTVHNKLSELQACLDKALSSVNLLELFADQV